VSVSIGLAAIGLRRWHIVTSEQALLRRDFNGNVGRVHRRLEVAAIRGLLGISQVRAMAQYGGDILVSKPV